MPGVPRATYLPFPVRNHADAEAHRLIAYEFAHATRTIFLDGTPHMEDLDFWMGDARGKWEGDTLVVDTVSLGDQTWFDEAGNFHSDALKVVERFTPIDATHINYEVTIDDAKVFTRPWKMSMIIYRRAREEPRAARLRMRRARLREAVQGEGGQAVGEGARHEHSTRRTPRDCRWLLPSLARHRRAGAAHRRTARGRLRLPAAARRPPANYPPYTRPVSTYVPPRTPDGQPDISGLYLAIPLPRNIETPLVPMAEPRAEPRQRRVLVQPQRTPEAARGRDRAARRRRSGGRQDPAEARGAGAAQGDHREPGEDRAPRRPRAVPRARRPAQHHPGAGGRLPDLPEAGLRRHLLRAEPPLSHDPARRSSAARSEHPQGDGRVARPLGRQRARRRGDELHQQPRATTG